MTQAPLPGEQSALRGYRWQYDHVARLVYDALVDDELDRVVLASNEAGQIDDLILFLKDRRSAYQFKGAVSRATISLNELIRPGQTASGVPNDSLWRSLARAWTTLRTRDNRPLTLHLSMAASPSTGDHVVEKGERPVPDHFRAFLARALEPVLLGKNAVEDFPLWRDAFEKLRVSAALNRGEFAEFLRSVRIELDLGEPLLAANGRRKEDLRVLSDTLLREVASGSGPVELDRTGIISLLGWGSRLSFRSAHEFPVDQITYSPLSGAIEVLGQKIQDVETGYIAVTGPPGAGKSTLLTEALSGSTARVIRYYAFVPGDGVAARNRLSAEWFLHDLSSLLRAAGLRTHENDVPSPSIQDLRQAVEEQLEAAGAEYRDTGRKTIIVVDGLDHVQRDYPGTAGLTAELPRPSALPAGVNVVVGTRDLVPLPSEASQQIADLGSEVNLENQRLSRLAMLQVCERFEATKRLPRRTQELIADRSGGHPLSFVYILGSIDQFEGHDSEEFVQSLPQYGGDIAMLYRAVWDSLDAEGELERVLGVCSRLRVGFDLDWVKTWAPDAAIRLFRSRLRYLFRVERHRWRFFHDSFRQYARERTSIGDERIPDAKIDRDAHAEVAEICERSADLFFANQALYHRSLALDFAGVRRLGTQESARRQFSELRPAADIADDAKRVLSASAADADFQGLLRGLLILSEVQDKASEIEEIDVCQALWRSGLTDLAIEYVGDEQGLRVPAGQAYHLAADLATDNFAAGKRIFDLFQHVGFEAGAIRSRDKRDAASGWARCAARYLGEDVALQRIRAILLDASKDRDWEFTNTYSEFQAVLMSYVRELPQFTRAGLALVDELIRGELDELGKNGPIAKPSSDAAPILSSLRVEIHAFWLSGDVPFEEGIEVFSAFRESLKGSPVFMLDLLDLAELETKFGSEERAATTLERTNFGNALTLSELGAAGDEGAIATHYRYWYLKHKSEIARNAEKGAIRTEPLASRSASPATPAGDSVAAGAPLHRETEAIALAGQIDNFIRRVALLQASISSGAEVEDVESWEIISTVINLYPPLRGRNPSNSLHTLRWKREELHMMAIDVLADGNPRLASWYEQAMSRRFESQPEEWPASLRVRLGLRLSDLGVKASWLPASLETLESEASVQGVNGALVDLAALVGAYSDLGELESAQRVCRKLWMSAFGLGSRNDYQLTRWVEWFGRAAVRLPDVEDQAFWLAKLLVAAEPISDQPLGAEDLPAEVALASPRAALSVFEYLVAHGTVAHADALANVLRAILVVDTLDSASIQIACDLTAGVVAACGSSAAVALAEALRSRANASMLVSLRDDLLKKALPSTRSDWLRSLGFESGEEERSLSPRDEEDSYGGLRLADGSRLSRAAVADQAKDLESLRSFVEAEEPSSYFDWVPVLERSFTSEQSSNVATVFRGTSNEAKVLVWLAEREYARGQMASAEEFGRAAFALSPLDAWSRMRSTVRRDAVRLLVKIGCMSRVEAAEDFVQFVTDGRWYSSMLTTDIDEIFEAIGANTAESGYWETVRRYLDGVAENLSLPQGPRKSPALKWWLLQDVPGRRSRADLGAADALAELAVMHLTHPAWAVREGTTQAVLAALKQGSSHVLGALERLIFEDPTDDVLETVGGILAACAGPHHAPLAPLRAQLARHRNYLVRRLSSPSSGPVDLRVERPLSGTYRMQFSDFDVPTKMVAFGESEPFLAPFESAYEVLAELSGLDLTAIIAVAQLYVRSALLELPEAETLTTALSNARMRNVYPTSEVLASRAAFGRVLADLIDSGYIDRFPPEVEPAFRTGDVGLVGSPLSAMPEGLPAHPLGGHDQTPERWAAGLEERADDFVTSLLRDDWQIVGAFGELAVLNWSHLEETFEWTAFPRAQGKPRLIRGLNLLTSDLHRADVGFPSGADAPMLLRNRSDAFMERRANWVALNPAVARSMLWKPDRSRLGGWLTAEGKPAAETRMWTNGTWGRHGQAFDDAVSEGAAVLVSEAGLRELRAALGPINLAFRISRSHSGSDSSSRRTRRQVEL